MQKQLISELEFCIQLWSTEGGCTFGGSTRCIECAAPYLTLKLLTGEILHGDMKRLTLEEWQKKVAAIKAKFPNN